MTIPTAEETIPQQIVRHPLDPLSAEEISLATRILSTSGRLTPRTRIITITLLEPAKSVIFAFHPGQPITRETLVIMRDHERRLTVEAIVSLTDETIRLWRERNDVQPALTYPEVFAAQQAVLADADFQAALAKRGITD